MRGPGRFLTQDCLLCAEPDVPEILCGACADDLPRLPQPCCRRCALPIANGEICGRCLNKPPRFDAALAAFAYGFPLDKLIQSFKYGHRLALAAYFGERLAELAEGIAADRILPMPLHPRRLRECGFNQALELARPLGAAHPGRRRDLPPRPRHASASRPALARTRPQHPRRVPLRHQPLRRTDSPGRRRDDDRRLAQRMRAHPKTARRRASRGAGAGPRAALILSSRRAFPPSKRPCAVQCVGQERKYPFT